MECRDIRVEENLLSGCIIYLLKKQTLVDFLFFVLYFYCSFNYQSFFFNYYLFLTIARKKKTSKLWIYRWMAETVFSSIKRMFGEYVSARKFPNMTKE